ncbi:hypothetical protein KIN20_023061 [Parelaphostrongylus tenuis]|uniref:Uncharacterized protein n=1 Tax=Parelaphostrongylus tenuis TaxID=148309 RepID=A0AAD5NBY8_PARTN|nr:hypothetical protein KIN20_023061 [Parelaphostrongylus tenuis]
MPPGQDKEWRIPMIVNVLEQQGRSTRLPDSVISGILGQLMVLVSYESLGCMAAAVNPIPTMES